jgi:YbbR domain-containing protein
MRAKKWITNNLGLKILSLILAIGTWFYVNHELTRIKNEGEKAIVNMLRYDVILKRLPIQLTVVGEVKEGYEIVTDSITIDPKTCIVIGPKNILNEVSFARTMPVDVTGCAKDIDEQVALAPIATGIALKDNFVKVYIPIVQEKEPTSPQKEESPKNELTN